MHPLSHLHSCLLPATSGGDNASKMGAKDVVPSTRGCIEAIDAVSMERNGQFIGGNYGEGIKDTPW